MTALGDSPADTDQDSGGPGGSRLGSSGLGDGRPGRRPPPPAVPGVRRGARRYVPHGSASESAGWTFAETAGRLVELSSPRGGSAVLTLATALVRDAQRQGETTAWCSDVTSLFFPPDAARAGVDLAALVIVRVPDTAAVSRAAERLLRSGAFGLVVLDLVAAGLRARVPPALLNRLAALAREHEATALCLTEKPDSSPSLGPLVSLRATARRVASPAGHITSPAGGGGFAARLGVLRDRRRPDRPSVTLPCLPPEGTEALAPARTVHDDPEREQEAR